MGKALVLGEDTRSFLTVVRSLGRKGIEIHVAWCTIGAPELKSRYIKQIHHLPPYRTNPAPKPKTAKEALNIPSQRGEQFHKSDFSEPGEDWLECLKTLLKREKFDLVFATNDSVILPLQKRRAELEPYARLALLDDLAFDIGFSKVKANELARSLEIPLPRERKITNLAESKNLLRDFTLPVVLKPMASFSLEKINRKRFVRKAYTPDEIKKRLKDMLKDGAVWAQENFIGVGMGVELLANKGEILVSFMHQRVHEPLMGGGSSYRKSVSLRHGMLEAAGKLIAAMDYTGVAMVEYKLNTATGEWVFIEINARFWGSIPLAVAAGVDFPWYYYQMLVYGRTEFPQGYRKNIYCRNLLNDLRWQWQNLKADKSDPTLATLPLKEVVKELKNILTFREYSDTFAFDDPLPGLVELVELKKLWAEGIRILQLRVLSQPRIRTVYTLHTRRRFRKAKTILFICKGNICRSPFAEYYGRRVFTKDKEVISAGYLPYPGRPSPPEALVAAQTFGINLAAHRSRVVDACLLRKADIIFTFDEENRLALLREYPAVRYKIVRLGLLVNRRENIISDPYSGSEKQFIETYKIIRRAIIRLL